MSGTLRTTPGRGAGVIAVIGVLHLVLLTKQRVCRQAAMIHRRGGLSVQAAVPVAVAVTAVVVAVTTAVAGSWITP